MAQLNSTSETTAGPSKRGSLSAWQWLAVIGFAWQCGLPFLGYIWRRELWNQPSLLLPLIATWELGGLVALAVHTVLPGRPREEGGGRLFVISIVAGAIATFSFHALTRGDALTWGEWEGPTLLIGAVSALVSGVIGANLIEFGVRKTVSRLSMLLPGQRNKIFGKLEATVENMWRVIEVRFGVKCSDVGAETSAAINESDDLEALSAWFEAALAAQSLEAFESVVAGSRSDGVRH
jgi:hypothetical protein